ncbi:MAG: hypothetical protein AAF696_24215, partial [Bacteroidota bacterium]
MGKNFTTMYYPKFSTIATSVFISIYLLLPIQALKGQGNPQAEQDCINAIPICSQVITQANSYTGEGRISNEIDPLTSCLGTGEENDVWYRVDIAVGGFLSFLITPNVFTDDYDFAVYNLTNANCSDIRNNPLLEVSCNYSATAGATGANLPGRANRQGAGGPNRNAPIPTLSGETYVINISNFSSSASGFQLDLTSSTAIFTSGSGNPPMPDSIYQDGNTDTLILSFTEPVLCNSISASSFSATLNSSPTSLDSLWSENCISGGSYASSFKVLLDDPILSLSQISVSLIDTVQGLCGSLGFGGSVQTQISLRFQISATPNPICLGDSILINTDYATPGYTILSIPESATTDSICVSPDSNKLFFLHILDS